MNELIELLQAKYPDVISINEENHLFKVIVTHNNVAHKIMYFDFSQQIPESYDEIETYHHNYIASSYYEIPGSIQWNHYIFFIYSIQDYTLTLEQKSFIESNKDYAKKIVFTQEEFYEYLNSDITNFYHEAVVIADDLIGIWRNQLDANQLQIIYDSSIAKSNLVENFLESNTEFQNAENRQDVQERNVDINFPNVENTFIQTLHLNQYRNYPRQQDFSFTTANLIHGANGTGKTSLLESIEIITCGGKTLRSNGEVDSNAENIILGFAQGNYIFGGNKNNPIYKERDKLWYGSTIETGNKLYENFNRFNYYHADAAYMLDDETDINEVIKKLVLGKDIAMYEKKIIQAQEEFEKETRRLTRESSMLVEEITTIENEIQSLGMQHAGIDEYYNQAVEIMSILRWTKSPLQKDTENTQLSLEVSTLIEVAISLERLCLNNKVSDLSFIENIYEENEKKLNDFQFLIEKYNNLTKSIYFCERQIEILKNQTLDIQKLINWLAIENISILHGLEARHNILKTSIIELSEKILIVPSIEVMKPYLGLQVNLVQYQQQCEQINLQQKDQKNQLLVLLQAEEIKIGQLSTCKDNLQTYALEILNLTNDKTSCPVCNAIYPEDQLLNIIQKITQSIKGIELIQQYKDELKLLESKIYQSNMDLTIATSLMECMHKLLEHNQIHSITVEESINLIEKLKDDLAKNQAESQRLLDYKNKFLSFGITEDEYSKLLTQYNDTYQEKWGLLSIETLEKINHTLFNQLLSEKNKIDEYNSESNILMNTIYDSNIKTNVQINAKDFEEYKNQLLIFLTESFNNSKHIKKQKDLLLSYIHSQNLNVEFITQHIALLSVLLNKYTELIIENKKISIASQSLNTKLQKNKEIFNSILSKLEKLNDALRLLNILDKSEDVLLDFFENNTKDILNVFMKIHSPKEFDSLRFRDGNIELKRISHDTFEPITRISTGQKSALALSIFLTMNRNANTAPRYILFDDPVSNVDDINILAFFDFLRDLTLSGQRQIIFATASSKIANLFKKKFDFLGDQFKYYQLER